MTRLPIAVALALLAAPALASGQPDSAAIGARLQVVSADTAPAAPTDDALFGRSDWSLASATPTDALAR